jgi:hypothetical protein
MMCHGRDHDADVDSSLLGTLTRRSQEDQQLAITPDGTLT